MAARSTFGAAARMRAETSTHRRRSTADVSISVSSRSSRIAWSGAAMLVISSRTARTSTVFAAPQVDDHHRIRGSPLARLAVAEVEGAHRTVEADGVPFGLELHHLRSAGPRPPPGEPEEPGADPAAHPRRRHPHVVQQADGRGQHDDAHPADGGAVHAGNVHLTPLVAGDGELRHELRHQRLVVSPVALGGVGDLAESALVLRERPADVDPAAHPPYVERANRSTAFRSSSVLALAASGSPDASASATQWFTWASRIFRATLSRAVVTALIWVRISMQ